MAQLGLSRRGRGKEGRKSWRVVWRQDLGPEHGPGSPGISHDGKPLQQLARGGGEAPVEAPLLRVGAQALARTSGP